MQTKTSPLDALEPGDTTIAELQPTIEFAGRTFHVAGYIGNGRGSGVMIIDTESKAVDPEDIFHHCIGAGLNFIVMHGDFETSTPSDMLDSIQRSVGEWFWDIHRQHQATLAARGKPS